ncbi:hypothetical protein EMMF5_006283 [Cystobasidiomycetes sp. EMM_F5]
MDVTASSSNTPVDGAQQPTASTSMLDAQQDVNLSAGPSAKPSAVKVYKPPKDGSMPRIPDLPDSYYQPSSNDLRLAQAGQSQRLAQLGVNTNFTTRKQRDLDARKKEEKRVNRYPRTTIRIRFPDRHQLETTFPSSKTLQAVYDFTKESLNEEWRESPFILYTPPRFELRLNDPKVTGKSLLDLQLAPSSALHIKFSEESLNESATRAPLRADLLDIAEDLPAPPSFDPTPEQIAAQEAARKSELEQQDKGKESTVGSNTSGNKVPKWLQKVTPGKKN